MSEPGMEADPALVFHAVSDEWIGAASLRFEPGLNVITGDPAPLGRIVEIAAGARKPRRGRALLRGADVALPSVRRRVAAAFAEEELIAAPRVLDALSAAIGLRGLGVGAHSVLDRVGLQELGARRPERLERLERRAVALALALADENAEALVLDDPLALGALLARSAIVNACLARARRIPVLVTTPELEDALLLGGRLFTFARGAIYASPARYTSGVSIAVHSKQARKLASLLTGEPGVGGVVFDAERAPYELSIKGADPELLAETIVRVACESSIPIASLVTHVASSRAALTMPGPWALAPAAAPGTRAESR